MNFIDFAVRLHSIRNSLNHIYTYFALIIAVMIGLSPVSAKAQQSIIQKGDAVVTGYSGLVAIPPPPGASQEDFVVIDQQGASLQVFDMTEMYGRDDARLVKAPRNFSVPALTIGQVFGVTLDDGKDSLGRKRIPNIYATATSAFGLQLVKTRRRVRNRVKAGGANRSWMGGQFGVTLGGGPGSIWKIDGRTGKVTLFANVKFRGEDNSAPALGNITFARRSRHLFVSDLQTGMIHAFDLKGVQVDIFDHGTSGRPKLGLPKVAYDPSSRVEITAPAFKAAKPSTWGFAIESRRVWGVGVFGSRLYYSVAEGPEIWSVGIKKDGTFANNVRVETEVSVSSSDEISDITFSRDGTMYLSQRGRAASSYDYTKFAKPKTAAVLRYKKRKLRSGRVVWRPAPEEYAVGFPEGFRSANGGIALGYGYDRYGFIRYDRCQSTLWSTGERLRQNPRFKPQLTTGGALIVHGLQGNSTRIVRPANEAPFKTYFIDYDSHHNDPENQGHMGDVAIWSSCRGGSSSSNPPPKPPVGPRIRITKKCSPASFGGQMRCRVTLTNTGSEAPTGRVGFTDVGKVLSGAAGFGGRPLIVRATVDDQAWDCSNLPARSLRCSIEGAVLEPGHRHSVNVVMDISGLVGSPGWRVRNCATLDSTGKSKCVTRGQNNALIVSKSGPTPQSCIAGGPCDFEVSVSNPGNRTFDGPLLFGDNLTISGVPVAGIVVDGVFPNHGCVIAGGGLPLQWKCHITLPPGGIKVFNLLLTIPQGAGPAAGVTTGRNCFVAANPGLLLVNNAVPPNFWGNVLNPANAGNSPGTHCINFSLQAPPPNQVIPKRKVGIGLPPPNFWGIQPIITVSMTVTPDKAFFNNIGEIITFTYVVSNTSAVPIKTFTITDDTISPGIPIGNCNRVDIPIGGVAVCTHQYITTAADINNDIVTQATLDGTW